MGGIALTLFGFGMALWINGWAMGPVLFALFLAILVYMMIGWFGSVSAAEDVQASIEKSGAD